MHKQFRNTVDQCFETNRPTELETGLKMLGQPVPEVEGDPEPVPREATGYVSELYSDTRPIYMPPAAAEIIRKLQSKKQEEQLQHQKLLKKTKDLQKIMGTYEREAPALNKTKTITSATVKPAIAKSGRQPAPRRLASVSVIATTTEPPRQTDRCPALAPSPAGKRKGKLGASTVDVEEEGKGELYQEFHIQFQRKKDAMVRHLADDLQHPYSGGHHEPKGKQPERIVSKLRPKPALNDPIRKIMQTNARVVKYKRIENKKLLRILERIELDKPILMHDKLDIIWDKDSKEGSPERAEGEDGSPQAKSAAKNPESFNQYQVKTELERLKLGRNMRNKRQIRAYKRMLQLADEREIVFHSG